MKTGTIVGIAISAAALTTLIAGTALGLDRRVEAWLDDVLAADVSPTPIEPLPVAVTAVAAASPSATEREARPADDEAIRPPDAPTIAIPELDDVRVSRAWRTMRERGLRLEVRDEYGAAIPREDAASYRVRGESMEPPAGAQVAEGTTVRARAELPPSAFSGY